MACNKWIPSGLTAKAKSIPVDQRIEFMVSNSLQPIPEHKLGTLYFYLFGDPFRPSLFGNYGSIMELIASKPTLYRTKLRDGRALIHSYDMQSTTTNNNGYDRNNNNDNNNHTNPQWSITVKNKHEIFGKMSVIFKIQKNKLFIVILI